MVINYQYFVPKGTKINLAKYYLARIFKKMLLRQARLNYSLIFKNLPSYKAGKLPEELASKTISLRKETHRQKMGFLYNSWLPNSPTIRKFVNTKFHRFLLLIFFMVPGLVSGQSAKKTPLSFQQLTDSTVHYYLKLGNYEKALPFAIPRRDSIRNQRGSNSLDYANACRSLGDMYSRLSRFKEADTEFEIAISLCDSILPEQDPRKAIFYNSYGLHKFGKGAYASAMYYLKQAEKHQALKTRKDTVSLAVNELILGRTCYLSNQPGEAENRLHHALQLFKSLFGDVHMEVATTYGILGNAQVYQGNYRQANSLFQKGLESLRGLEDGQSRFKQVELQTMQAVCQFYLKKYPVARLLYQRSLSLIDSMSTLSGQMSHHILFQKGELYKSIGLNDYYLHEYAPALQKFQYSLKVLEGVLPENHQTVQEVRLNLALALARMGKYRSADSLFQLTRRHMEANMGKESSQLNALSLEQALFALSIGRRAEAMQRLDSLEQNILLQIDAIFLNFAATENEAFLLSLEEYRSWISGLLAAEAERNAAMASRLLDVHLNLHGILLSSERSVLQALRRQNEPVMAQKAETWFALRKQLAALQADGKIKADSLSAFEEKVNSLEKELIRQRSNRKGGFSANTRAGAEIEKTLKKGQAAVQIIRVAMPGMVTFTDRSDSLHRSYVYPDITDTIHYLALIIKPGTAHPALVSLRRGNWLEKQGLANYRNQIRRQQEDPLSYGLFWQAIDSALGPEVKEVFYCPDGVYHSLNPASVLVPGKGRYLSELRSWVRLTRLADLNEPAPERNNQKQAVLIGAPAFADGYRLSAGEEEQSRFEPLPGTLSEVNSVNQAMQKSGWKTSLFTGTTASEEAVKNLRSPAVLHLATHGYFRQDTLGGSHAMLSSGLILAGPDKAYPSDSSRREDGILKAREAQTLDLEGTDLVVLSACETGLGTSLNGEGMYGLQRAFQLAGCRQVLMSLWKIDDEATSRLMKAFYRHYLPSGDAQLALRLAQTELRKSYPHPYYWASFLILGR